MDMESLCAGLLHDTVEDNPHVASFQEIEVRLEMRFLGGKRQGHLVSADHHTFYVRSPAN